MAIPNKLSARERRMLRLDGVSTADAIKVWNEVAQACNGTKFPRTIRTGAMTKRDRAIERAMAGAVNFSGAQKDRKSE